MDVGAYVRASEQGLFCISWARLLKEVFSQQQDNSWCKEEGACWRGFRLPCRHGCSCNPCQSLNDPLPQALSLTLREEMNVTIIVWAQVDQTLEQVLGLPFPGCVTFQTRLPSLKFCFLICKMGTVAIPSAERCCEDYMRYTCEGSVYM